MKSLADLKAQARRVIWERVALLDTAQKDAAIASVQRRLASVPEWQSARCVLLYAPIALELDVWPILLQALAQNKQVALPAYDPMQERYRVALISDPVRDIYQGRFGVREPHPDKPALALEALDFALIPGVGFDSRGGRLGRGKGYFDRLLLNVNGVTCGVGFDEQLVEHLPTESHDVVLKMILTPSQTLRCNPAQI